MEIWKKIKKNENNENFAENLLIKNHYYEDRKKEKYLESIN